MRAISASRTALPKVQNPLLVFLERMKRNWSGVLLIAVVVGYVAFLIITPITALALGAFEKGLGASLSALNQPEIFSSFWNTLWISLEIGRASCRERV